MEKWMLLHTLLLIAAISQNTLSQQHSAQVRSYGNTATDCFVSRQILNNNQIMQRSVSNEQECIQLCLNYPSCKAMMWDNYNYVCSIYGSGYRIDNTADYRYRIAKRECIDTALREASSKDSGAGNMFQLVDSSGNYITGQQNGLLLYNGATVCGSKFNGTAAHAVCKLMGFKHALSIKTGYIWKIQEKFEVHSKRLVCSVNDWSSCSFITDENGCQDHSGDLFLTCSGDRSPFTLVNFSGTQVSGYQQFLLLYNGGTVCGDYFNDISASAVCRDMGYNTALGWRKGASKGDYHISLDDVKCADSNWKSCTYSTSHDCTHGQVVYLSCSAFPEHEQCSFILEVLQYYSDDSSFLSTALAVTATAVTTVFYCLYLSMIHSEKNYISKIEHLQKKSVESDNLVKNLQDELEELKRNRKTFQKPILEESSSGEHQNVLGPD